VFHVLLIFVVNVFEKENQQDFMALKHNFKTHFVIIWSNFVQTLFNCRSVYYCCAKTKVYMKYYKCDLFFVWNVYSCKTLLYLLYTGIDQFRYIKIQPKTIDLSTRLVGINRVCGVYSQEPRTGVYCFRLNFNISKLVS